MRSIFLRAVDRQAYVDLLDDAKNWCREHQLELGLAEMALGAACVHWAVHAGVITVGKEIVATALHSGPGTKVLAGAFGGATLGGVAGSIIGGIGIAAAGTAIGIPAAIVIGGGALIGAAVGYSVTDLLVKYLDAIDYGTFFRDAAVLSVGLALILDGARRVANDQGVRDTFAMFRNSTVYLSDLAVPIVATSLAELKAYREELTALPTSAGDGIASIASTAVAGAGAATVGASVAASSVTVLGSHALGGVALSLGLVSAPVWPVAVAGVAGAALGYAGWKLAKRIPQT